MKLHLRSAAAVLVGVLASSTALAQTFDYDVGLSLAYDFDW